MRRFLECMSLVAALVLCAASCQKKYVTNIILAVDYNSKTGVKLATPDSTSFAIHITSNGEWTAWLDAETPEGERTDSVEWCELDREAGAGTDYIICTCKQNKTASSRTATFHVSGQGKECTFPITQAKAE